MKNMTVMAMIPCLCIRTPIGHSFRLDWMSIPLLAHLVSAEWEQMVSGLAVCCLIVNADELGDVGCGGGGCASCGTGCGTSCGGGGCGGGCSAQCSAGGCSDCQC